MKWVEDDSFISSVLVGLRFVAEALLLIEVVARETG
jgi:hypothetical protein